jgi:hypothetical protein
VRPVEAIPGIYVERQRRMKEGVNSAMIYFKTMQKCDNVPPIQQ